MEKTFKEINELFDHSSRIIIKSKLLTKNIDLSIKKIIKCLENKNKIVVFGNGGSAADAQHIAAEFIGRYLLERRSLPAIALTTDTSILTALGNDYGFERVFARQCETLVCRGDIVIAISTSGESINVIEGVKAARKNGGIIIGLLGGSGGKLKNMSDVPIIVPSQQTPRIQEAHRTIIHIICELVEKHFSTK